MKYQIGNEIQVSKEGEISLSIRVWNEKDLSLKKKSEKEISLSIRVWNLMKVNNEFVGKRVEISLSIRVWNVSCSCDSDLGSSGN